MGRLTEEREKKIRGSVDMSLRFYGTQILPSEWEDIVIMLEEIDGLRAEISDFNKYGRSREDVELFHSMSNTIHTLRAQIDSLKSQLRETYVEMLDARHKLRGALKGGEVGNG